MKATTAKTGAHTPGPWSISADGQRILGIETPDEQPVIAEVFGAACEDQEGAANARLIASAPDLLAALEGVVEWAELKGLEHGPLWPALKDSRAAIAKAKGVQP